MIRKTKKGPRRLREMPVVRAIEYVRSGAGPYRGSVKPHTAYRTSPTSLPTSRHITLAGMQHYILLNGCGHLNGENWNVEYLKERL